MVDWIGVVIIHKSAWNENEHNEFWIQNYSSQYTDKIRPKQIYRKIWHNLTCHSLNSVDFILFYWKDFLCIHLREFLSPLEFFACVFVCVYDVCACACVCMCVCGDSQLYCRTHTLYTVVKVAFTTIELRYRNHFLTVKKSK